MTLTKKQKLKELLKEFIKDLPDIEVPTFAKETFIGVKSFDKLELLITEIDYEIQCSQLGVSGTRLTINPIQIPLNTT